MNLQNNGGKDGQNPEVFQMRICLSSLGYVLHKKELQEKQFLVIADQTLYTYSDEAVDVQNTLQYATRLKQVGVGAEVHIYPEGKHGLGLANEGDRCHSHVALWADALISWIKDWLEW